MVDFLQLHNINQMVLLQLYDAGKSKYLALHQLYLGEGISRWSQKHKNDTLSIKLHFNHTYRKEGLLAIQWKK